MTQSPGTNNQRSDGFAGPEQAPIDVRELIAGFWRRRWLIAGIAVLVLLAFGWRWKTRVPEYRAVGSVQVMREKPTVPGLGLDAPVPNLPADPIRSEVEVIRSRTLLDAVAESLALRLTLGPSELRRDRIFREIELSAGARPGAYTLVYQDDTVELRDSAGAVLASAGPGLPIGALGVRFIPAERPSDYPDEIPFYVNDLRGTSERLAQRLSVAAVEGTNLIDVRYHGHDPELAAEIVNAVMELARHQSIGRQRQQASARRQFIESQLAEFERQLRAAQQQVQEYQEQVGAVSIESEEAGQINNILSFERQVEELRLERQLYEPILAELEGTDADAPAAERQILEALSATPALVKNPAIGDLYSRLIALEVKRDSLVSGPGGAGPNNYAVQAVDGQIETARVKLGEAIHEYVQGIDRQMSALRGTIRRLRQETEGFLPHAAELARRQQRVESLRKVYETLQTQLEQTRIEEAAESGRLTIIDPAVRPREPINATGLSDIFLALVLAGMLGFGTALVVEYFDDRVRTPDEIRRGLGATVLGVVPRFDSVGGWARGDRNEPRVHADPHSPPAEAYRMIRTNLSFSLAVKPRTALLVTSPGPGEGKTTTATNLAMALAHQGDSVVLLDADLRKSAVHRLVGCPRDPGLTAYLRGDATLDEIIEPSGVDGMDVVPAGALPPNPAELVGSEPMQRLLTELAGRYDHVLVDSPPLLAVADPAVLARHTDGALLVVRVGQTGRGAVVNAIERLQDVGGDLVGVVVNAFRPGPGYGSSHYYYYYRDGYGGEDGRPGPMNRLRRWLKAGGRR